MTQKIVCVAGASAVGKSSVINEVVAHTNAEQAYSLTTRELRGATDHRFHVSRDEFDRRKNDGDFIEHIAYGEHGEHLYGISKSVVNGILQKGKTAILDCNIEGVTQVLKAGLDAQVITIFLACSAEQLYNRQIQRDGVGLNSETKLFRLRNSLLEIEGAEKKETFQYVLLNNSRSEVVEKIIRIIEGDTSVESDPFDVAVFKKDMLEILKKINNKEMWTMTDRCEEMSFENFEITPENYANFNMCKSLLAAPQNFRLIFLHMPSHERLHLKHALLNGWREKDKDIDWCSITASEFTSELLEAIRKANIPYDARKWIAPDILLVDDIQELTGEATQIEFYRSILKKRLEQRKTTILFSEVSMEHLRLIMRDEVIHLMKLGVKEEVV